MHLLDFWQGVMSKVDIIVLEVVFDFQINQFEECCQLLLFEHSVNFHLLLFVFLIRLSQSFLIKVRTLIKINQDILIVVILIKINSTIL